MGVLLTITFQGTAGSGRGRPEFLAVLFERRPGEGARTPYSRAPYSRSPYSHSIVPGGLEVTS